jgi:ubiquinone/menaquinone biosynthesis C-methylase UbiE
MAEHSNDTYTHGHHESVLRSHSWRTAENSAAYLLAHLRPGQRLLDVGCGPGTITADLAALVVPGEVVAIDNAPAVLEKCRATLAELGIGNVTVMEADIYCLPFEDGSFDVVHAHQVLQHLTDPVAALKEMRRVSQGLVAARDSDYPSKTWYPASEGLDRWMAMYLAVARSNGAEPAAGRRLLAWAHAAGFDEVRATASAWCFATPDERAWWGGLWADRVLSSALAEQALERGIATREDLESMSGAWRAWAEDPDGWYMVPGGEILCRV